MATDVSNSNEGHRAFVRLRKSSIRMMNFISRNKRVGWIHCAAGALLISFLAACNRDETKVYQVPKEDAAPPTQAAQPAPDVTPQMSQPDMGAPTDAAASVPALKYQLPEGWQEKPASDMRVASFSAPGPGGQSADVSVIPLPVVGRDMELINMWRSRVQLPATNDPDAVEQFEPVAIGAEQGRLFEFVSVQPVMGKGRQRLLVAMLTRDNMSWFFKMTGEDRCATSQKKHFLEFLKSVSFVENVPPQITNTPAPSTDNGNTESIWTVPSAWQSIPPAQFLLAEYSISGANGAKAEVNVAAMGGEGGGLLANVNRWRGQLGLGALSESDLPQLAPSLEVPGGTATMVDFVGTDSKTGAPTRLIGAIVSQNGQTWFYKMMGDKQVVTQQKDNFTKFIQSANYANAR
jgi:hypothetical protein